MTDKQQAGAWWKSSPRNSSGVNLAWRVWCAALAAQSAPAAEREQEEADGLPMSGGPPATGSLRPAQVLEVGSKCFVSGTIIGIDESSDGTWVNVRLAGHPSQPMEFNPDDMIANAERPASAHYILFATAEEQQAAATILARAAASASPLLCSNCSTVLTEAEKRSASEPVGGVREAREWAEKFLFPKVHPSGYSFYMESRVIELTNRLVALSQGKSQPTKKQSMDTGFGDDEEHDANFR